jgi:hypothetical protein
MCRGNFFITFSDHCRYLSLILNKNDTHVSSGERLTPQSWTRVPGWRGRKGKGGAQARGSGRRLQRQSSSPQVSVRVRAPRRSKTSKKRFWGAVTPVFVVWGGPESRRVRANFFTQNPGVADWRLASPRIRHAMGLRAEMTSWVSRQNDPTRMQRKTWNSGTLVKPQGQAALPNTALWPDTLRPQPQDPGLWRLASAQNALCPLSSRFLPKDYISDSQTFAFQCFSTLRNWCGLQGSFIYVDFMSINIYLLELKP